jgi:predicted TIM-barrel fold metal-dependent hydrolase
MRIKKYFFNILFFVSLELLLVQCTKEPLYYTMEDFTKIKKIDSHVHYNSDDTTLIDQAKSDNFRLLTINTDYPDFPPIQKQQEIAASLLRSSPDIIAYASTFYMKGWDDPQWLENTIKHLDSTFNDGAIAVKVWKNIGMDFRDKNGKIVMIDDPKFDPIFTHLKEIKIPLLGHQGEPRECWLPFDKMVIQDSKDYFKDHPQYHMYLHPEMPSYEDQMRARDNMVNKNKNIVFVAVHLASLEWSVDELAKFLDRFPNAVTDVAARMNQLQYQTKINREKVKQFFIKYQDRILYATDTTFDPGGDNEEFKREVHKVWLNDWKYLVTDSTMSIRDFEGEFKGLKLSTTVIDKIYRLNAERIFPKAWKN